MTIEFQYSAELAAFLQLFLLGMVLSTLVMYVTEVVKKWLTAWAVFAAHTWAVSLVCFAISMAFGLLWRLTFASESITSLGGLWLGLLLYLGSTGLYSKLENSDGFWGRTVTSYKQLIARDDLTNAAKEEEEETAGEQ